MLSAGPVGKPIPEGEGVYGDKPQAKASIAGVWGTGLSARDLEEPGEPRHSRHHPARELLAPASSLTAGVTQRGNKD